MAGNHSSTMASNHNGTMAGNHNGTMADNHYHYHNYLVCVVRQMS
jgi:hypothetical protein